ncbi:MAG: peptidoglycan DD-metalloendopeptidase family protein [Candidatus Spechtbacterales bacterium]
MTSLTLKKSVLLFIVLIMAALIANSWFVFAQEEDVVSQEEQGTGGTAEPQTDEEKIKEYERQIEESQKLLEELRAQAEEQSQNLYNAREEANTLESQIARFNSDVAGLQAKISIKQEEIRSTQLAIQKINLEIQKKEKEIQIKKDQMTAMIREINKNDSETTFELILKYESFSSFFNQVHAREALQENIDGDLQELKKLKEELIGANGTLETKRTELEEEQGVLRSQRIILENRRYNHQLLLRQTKEEESAYQEFLNDIRQKELEVNREIFELEDQLRRTLDPSALPSARHGILSWPADNVLITQGYGCLHSSFARASYPSCDNGQGGFHNGVDMAAKFGTPIKAARGGVVVAIENSPYAYGNWVAIKHDNGLVTVYTHMSDFGLAGAGSPVEEGERVGFMDSTGYSTGSHLHFMVYAPGTFHTKPSAIAGILPIGATLNPFDYLP